MRITEKSRQKKCRTYNKYCLATNAVGRAKSQFFGLHSPNVMGTRRLIEHLQFSCRNPLNNEALQYTNAYNYNALCEEGLRC